MPRHHLMVTNARLAQRFLFHRVAGSGAGAGVVARSLIFQCVGYPAAVVHQREIDALAIDAQKSLLVGTGEKLAERDLRHHLPAGIARDHRLVERDEDVGL